jgi:release factor glutamine methyltransferase
MKLEPLAAVRSRLREEALRRNVNPRDVDLLLSDLLGRPITYVFAHGDELIDARTLESQMERRFAGEPVQYIRGWTEFYGREFAVDPRVLIPRPETEILVEEAIARIPSGARVVDVGTGSGCIAVTIALERPDLRVAAVDISLPALALATSNRDRLGARVSMIAGDLLTAFRATDFVVSNPPYIPSADVNGLATEVRDHEPWLALTPGPNGSEAIRKIVQLSAGSTLIFEIGYGQEQEVRKLALAAGYTVERIIPDLAAIPRVVVLSAHGRK